MKYSPYSQSLLPYLESTGATFYFKLALASEVKESVDKLRFPFKIINDSHPLCRLIEVEAFTDAESRLKRVFFLMQRDHYFFINDELLPITNKDIDNFWQITFLHYLSYQQNSVPIIIANQISEKNELVPLQSLFFCNLKQTFFHPPCPKCGLALQQCYEDELLSGLGLHPYSTSLKRYLYCANCLDSKGDSDFYVYEREDSDSPLVKDRSDLIREFDHLLEEGEQPCQLPCGVCGNKEGCYGSEKQVFSKIVPLSFYPFYMFIFDNMSLQAPDFLALLAGASFEELEVQLANKGELGRQNYLRDLRKDRTFEPRFLFSGDERYFLEVLYLKLSFLEELAQIIFSGTFIDKRPDLGISIDQIWLKLGDQGGLLPSFWNFRVSPVCILTKPLHGPALPNLPSSYGLYILGLCWFYALLFNTNQDISQVYRALGDALEKGFNDEPASLNKAIMDDPSLSFVPENIFWNPALRTVHQSHHPLWEKALSLGCSLLRASNSMDPDWSKDEFLRQAGDLREEVKDKLFQGEPVSPRQIAQSENETITNILEGIKHKWLAEVQKTPSELPDSVSPLSDDLRAETQPLDAQAVGEGEFIPETVMLSPEEAAREIAKLTTASQAPDPKTEESPPPEAAQLAEDLPIDLHANDEEELIPETVMLSPEEAAREIAKLTAASQAPDPKTEESPPPEAAQLAEDLPIDLHANDEEGLIPETVMLSPTAVSGQPASASPDVPEDETALAEDQVKRRKRNIKDSLGDDFVVETVFLFPEEIQDENQDDTDE
ncbi:MAG: hypothetical protein P8X67_13100 [Syntrophobacterales bacterium]